MSSDDTVPFAVPDVGEAEIEAVVGVLRSRWLTTGRKCHEFEERFAAQVGATHAVALNSCTAALHLSLEALGVGVGDLVFLSPYTFAASAEVIRYLGAVPVFVDVDPTTLNIDAVQLRETVQERFDRGEGRPAAIIPVHYAGVPCAMTEIWALARETGLVVVEDAAHAFPASYNGSPVGFVPDDVRGTVCFSFYATKTVTTGEGGMLTTEDADLAERARSMSLHGLNRQAWSRYSGGGWAYDITAPGYKYNLTDIAAAMGLAQLSRTDEMVKRRSAIAEAYSSAFSELQELECPTVPDGVQTAWHLYPLRLNLDALSIDRGTFIRELTARGIGTSVHFIPLHLHSYYTNMYGYRPDDYPIATAQFHREISLPIYSAMTHSDVQRVIDAIADVVRHQATLNT